MTEACYYTIAEPEPRFIIWPPGQVPALYSGEQDVTGDRYALDRHFIEYTMIYVPWSVVQIMSGA